ncbi:MAG: ATP-dependent DNA helicase RecG [Burkholderiaceae bacterium]
MTARRSAASRGRPARSDGARPDETGGESAGETAGEPAGARTRGSPRGAGGARGNAKAERGRSGDDPFAKLGIRRPNDLLLHLPLRYEDHTRRLAIAELRLVTPGRAVLVDGEITRVDVQQRGRRLLRVELADETGTLGLRFFSFYPSQLKQLRVGQRLRVIGEPRTGLMGTEMVHPRYRLIEGDPPLAQTLTPVYPTVAGLAQARIQAAVARVLSAMPWSEWLDDQALSRLQMMALPDALRQLHVPPAGLDPAALEDRDSPAWRRLILDELLAQQLALREARRRRVDRRAAPLAERALAGRLTGSLPFALTGAQQRVWQEIAADLGGERPMNRLLQGDVGSGKTVVAALAAAVAIGSGAQVALMAPTEILAAQHAAKLAPWLNPLGVRIALLVGSMRERDKRAVREAVAAGEIDLIIGTHALIEQGCVFARLGLVVVDEQHRFGVAQRLKLREKTEALAAHQLMMSATPIPRTLAMSYYADLDVSVIDALPPGRQPVRTRLIDASRRDEVISRVREAALAGRQVYWVCPLIEESESLDLENALATHAHLCEAVGAERVGIVHGRQPAPDKEATMTRFVAGELQVLVATTVIEVGVDVPTASLMVIENAERFGLAQLHQLRGRVGRGTEASTCVLMYRGPLSAGARERLKALYETEDGFEIARRDLRQRGPGEFLGPRQSGLPLLRLADLERDHELLELARDLAAGPDDDGARHGIRMSDAARAQMLERWFGGREDFLGA